VTPRTVLLVAMLGAFMAFLDNTIVTIAFPNMLRSLPHSTLRSLSWVFNAYNIALAAFLVPAGQLADLLGRRRMFASGMLLFTLASAICAAAPSVGVLIAGRSLQGTGAAIIVPSSLALVVHAYGERQRVLAVALWSATGALAAGIGPSIGGLLVVLVNWRLVFVINLPLGAAGWWLARHRLVESRAPGRRAAPDAGGAALLALSIALVAVAVVQGPHWGWTDGRTVVVIGAALAAGVSLVQRERTHPDPIIDRELITTPGFALTSALTIVGAAGFYGLGLVNILYLIQAWHYSPLLAGLAGTPAPFLAAAVAALVGWLAAKRDVRLLIVLGAAVWAAGPLILIARFSTSPHYLTNYLAATAVLAVGIGIAFPLVSNLAVSLAPSGRYASATAVNATMRQIGAALGVALVVALIGHPGSLADRAAFRRGWLFSSACFGLVALGALALRRARPTAEAESFVRAVQTMIAGPRPTAVGAAPARRSRSVMLSLAVKPAVLGQSTEDFIGVVPLFAELSGSERSAIAQRATVVALPAGTWLFHQGDVADAMYIVRSGRVEVVAERSDGGEEVVRELRAGAALGELALVRRTRRTAGIRARRDAQLLRLDCDQFDSILRSSTTVSRSLLATLADWLSDGRASTPAHSRPPSTIAVVSVDTAADHGIEAVLATELQRLATVLTLPRSAATRPGTPPGRSLAELLDRAESSHDHVLLLGGRLGGPDDWTQACIHQADRVVLLLEGAPEPGRLQPWAIPRGSDVVLLGGDSDDATDALLRELEPRATHRVLPTAPTAGVARLARRLAGQSVGLALSGGGARCFSQIGVIEELVASGITIDRVAGTSMGAFIGALVAQGLNPAEIDARCYEEWVRRNPVSDYRFPRTSLIRGARARAMLGRVLPGRIEDLPLGFFCVTVDLISARPVYHRLGRLAEAVGASMILPGVAPPLVSEGRLLLDGGLLDNLPTEVMAHEGDGPIIAVDATDPSVRRLPEGVDPEVPTLVDTLFKVMLLSESDSDRRRSFADLLIRPDCTDIGTVEFHMLDVAREEGRRAAAAALESPSASILGLLGGAPG
jgi:EmrB/QacA subfamily drug resistance transporter